MKKALLASSLICLLPFQGARAEYFTVSEKTSEKTDETRTFFENSSRFNSPLELLNQKIDEIRSELSSVANLDLKLLKFVTHQGNFGETPEKYNRLKHFGTWVRDPNDGTCLNTRAKVLVRDSESSVSYNSNGCSVATGHWVDPYAGNSFSRASDIQIDHFVPLKNAYISGAFEWDAKRRCLYANFIGNDFHLLAVYGSENQRKSDRDPQGYMPPAFGYRCQYLAQWLKIKMIWQLRLSPSEKSKIVSLVQENHCDTQSFVLSSHDLVGQRALIANNMNLCRR